MGKKAIAVVGLGYVGLPLAIEFSRKYKVVGYDINPQRVAELSSGTDRTAEIESPLLHDCLTSHQDSERGLLLTSRIEDIRSCQIYIATVPTPISKLKTPDLSFLLKATKSIAQILKKGDIVVYESTVYPGCTEEECVPVLEQESGLKYNQDFFCGYSPERINPGDKRNTLTTIKKVVSASTSKVLDELEDLYGSIINAGTYRAPSIKVAEAAKAIENAQRDVNISFVNELALIFDKMGIDTSEVLEAASTKWNFLKFTPGLVGGHCIGVDPYYLLHKSQSLGYNPQVILSGRNVNDKMGNFIAQKVIKLMIRKQIRIAGSKVLILGFTFKENCPDIRNTKVVDVVRELQEYNVSVDVYDPHACRDIVTKEYGISLMQCRPNFRQYDGVILAVGHDEFTRIDFSFIKNRRVVLFDVKGVLPREWTDGRL